MSAGKESAQEHQPARRFGFLMLPNFSMMCLTSAVEPLRVANTYSGRTLYSWSFLSSDGEPVSSSNGGQIIADAVFDQAGEFDDIVICGGLDSHLFKDKSVLAWLRRHARSGKRVGALSDAAHILAQAGLLAGYHCTIHWKCMEGFRETYPEIAVEHELYVIDRGRYTAAGGSATMDLVLHLIEQDQGRDLAVNIADNFLHGPIRGVEDQRMTLRQRVGVGHPKLLEAVRLMEENIESPLSAQELAERVGLSSRQLERLFHRYMGQAPRSHYLEIRLQKAHMLLTHSTLSVMEVALACGFVSASHFSKRYRERFQRAPQQTRLGTMRRAEPVSSTTH